MRFFPLYHHPRIPVGNRFCVGASENTFKTETERATYSAHTCLSLGAETGSIRTGKTVSGNGQISPDLFAIGAIDNPDFSFGR